MDQDRNLLFGILAAQLNKVPPDKVNEAAAAWAKDPTLDLSDLLLAYGALTTQDRDLLQHLVEAAIHAKNNDAAAALKSLGGPGQIQHTFHGSVRLNVSGDVLPATLAIETPAIAGTESSHDLAPGVHESPGRYTRQTEHARGGMGRVLLVHDEHIGRDIALKELLPELSNITGSDPSSPSGKSFPLVSRFLQEARITGQLEHPSIVPVYELGTRVDGTLYYTMKLVRGRTLARAIRDAGTLQGRLKLLPHFIDLCNAIAYAHSRGVIHRDIKPGNVMVGEFGETVVLDWGIAKVLGKDDTNAADLKRNLREFPLSDDASHAGTEYGQALGTLVYMAPEQAKGHLELVDERSDVYALGAVLYELLTGTTPFDLTELHPNIWREILLKKVVEESPRPIAQLEPEVPPELAAIAMRALQKNHTNRYQAASELASEIQRFQTGALVSAYKYNLIDYFRRYYRRHRNIVLIACAALVVIAGLSAFYAEKLHQSQLKTEEARRRSEDTLYRSVMAIVPQYIQSGQAALAKKTLWAAPERCRGWEWGQRLASVDKELVEFEGTNILDARPAPDGNAYLLESYPPPDTTLHLWNMTTGLESRALKGHLGPVTAAALSPAGDHAVSISPEDKTLRLWELPSGTQRARIVAPIGTVESLDFSPRGDLFTLTSRPLAPPGAAAVEQRWTAADGREVPTGTNPNAGASTNPDNTRRIDIADDGTARIVDAATGVVVVALDTQGDSVNASSFSPDGTRVITRTDSGAVMTWDVATGRQLTTMEGKSTSEGYVALSADNSRALDCNFVSVRIWDADTGALLFTTWRNKRARFLAHFMGNGESVLTREDAAARIWDVDDLPEPVEIQGDAGEVPSINLNATRAAITTADNAVQISDVATRKELVRLEGHQDHIYTTQFSDSGRLLLTSSWDKTTRIWNVATGKTIAQIGPPDLVRFARFSEDDAYLWILSNTGAVTMWNVANGEKISELASPESPVVTAAYNPATQQIVTANEDRSLHLWDALTGTHQKSFKTDSSEKPRSVSINRDATLILYATVKEAQVWDVKTAALLRKIDRPSRVVPALSPDGSAFVDGWYDANKVVGIFHLHPGHHADADTELEGHETAIRCVAYSPDGTRILTGSLDKTARIWNAETGEILAVLEGHDGAVINAWFSPDGMRVVTITNANSLRVWNACPYREDQLPAVDKSRAHPGDTNTWISRYHLWKLQNYATWLAAHHGPS